MLDCGMADAFIAGPPPVATGLLLAASPFVGSFLATAAYRLPLGRSALAGRSSCPACGQKLGPADLVPVLGFALRRGRCAYCRAPVSKVYPLVEGLAFAAALWAVAEVPGWGAWAAALLGWFLLTLSVIDTKHFLLPNILTLPLAAIGLAVAGLGAAVPGFAWATAPLDAVIGAVAGYGFLALIAQGYQAVRGRAGLGMGDAKLLAASGAWAGWQGLASVVLIAALVALAVALAQAAYLRRRPGLADRLPFGPYLALGTWLVVLYGPLSFRLP